MLGWSHAAVKSAEYAVLVDACFDDVGHTNYRSFDEAGPLAFDEVTRLVDKGYAEHYENWQAVVGKWPNARATKVGVIVKEKSDGSHK
eukprot:1138821-Amphidinium_carterae.1